MRNGATTTAEETVDWTLCPACRSVTWAARLAREAGVCPSCGHHHPVPARERLVGLLDEGSVETLPSATSVDDPLSFVDAVAYPARLRSARTATGLTDAVLCARGRIHGAPVVLAVMEFRFMGGSLGSAVGEALTAAAEVALRERTPLVIVTASGGARMQEGAIALMQMAKVSQALGQLDEAGILTVSVITDPTYGGVAASFATRCDVIIAEPGARLGFAGPRVIEQTIGERLPEGFQTAEFLLQHGAIDLVAARRSLRPVLGTLLSIASRRPVTRFDPGTDGAQRSGPAIIRDPAQLADTEPWAAVRRARDLRRPTTTDYFDRMLDDFVELHGDRIGADCPAVVGGVGRIDGRPVVAIGHQKGHDARELAKRRFGMPSPAGYRKAARLMRLAAKLGLPVLTLVDTPGAHPGVAAEEQGQAAAIAENLVLMSGLPVPVVTVVTGEGGSGGALALAVANSVLACANATYSVISPEGCAAILWRDPAAAPAAAAALRMDPRSLLRLGVVDGVVPEPPDGAEADHDDAADRLRAAVVTVLTELSTWDPARLVAERRQRFRRFGLPDRPIELTSGRGTTR